MAENFLNLARDITLQIQEAEWPTNRINTKKSTLKYIITKLLETKDDVTLEDSLVVSHKTKNILTIQYSIGAPWFLPKWVENLHLQKNLHMNVYSSFIFIIAKTWKQSRCPSESEWTNCGASRQQNIIQHWKEMSY